MSNELRAGLFTVGALLVLAFAVYLMGLERRIFSQQTNFKVIFADVKGLAAGAPVRLGGLTVGRVEKIRFSDNLSDTRVFVSLLVDDEFADRVHRDSTASIETQGLLGDKFISLAPGGSAETLPADSVITTLDQPDISQVLSGIQHVVNNSADITDHLRVAMEGLGSDALTDLVEATKSFSELARDVKSSNGLIHRLIYSESDGQKVMTGVADASSAVSALVKRASTGPGLLHALVYDEKGAQTLPALVSAVEEVGKTAVSFKTVLDKVKDGGGPLAQLLFEKSADGSNSSRDLSQALSSMREALKNLEVTSRALAQGQGSLGALLVDSRIYDSLLELTDNANRSFLLRQVVRSTLEK